MPDPSFIMHRLSHRPGLVLAALAICWWFPTEAVSQLPIRNQGILISEVHHNSYDTRFPSYIEIVNVDPIMPVNLSGTQIALDTGSAAPMSIRLPLNTQLPPLEAMVVTEALIPSVPTNRQLVRPQLFAGNFRPNQAFGVCIDVPVATGNPYQDGIVFNRATMTCANPLFPGQSVNFTEGLMLRVLYLDSNTGHDVIDVPRTPPAPVPPVTITPAPSPGMLNPEMSHMTGFRLRDGTNMQGVSIPLPILGAPGTSIVSGNPSRPVSAVINTTSARIRAVGFLFHPNPQERVITDPNFDEVLRTGRVTVGFTIRGDDPLLARATGTAMTWRATVPNSAGQDGILTINMGPLSEVGSLVQFQGTGAANQRLRVERTLSDNMTDGTARGSGGLSPVQIDALPEPGGPGDVWCELVVYDMSGFTYKAKVKNWPANPQNCSTPNLGLGSNSPGELDIVALCFSPMAELFVLPSSNMTTPTGSGFFFGLDPDTTTLTFLGLPLGTDPAHVTATGDGLYYSRMTGLPPGAYLEAVAVEFVPGIGFTQFSPVATVTVM